jgi:hypothetical protein
MKRLGHRYFTVAVAAMCTSSGDPVVLYGERIPSRVTLPTRNAAIER